MSDEATLAFVVDADPAARRTVGQTLEGSGLRVVPLDSAEELLTRTTFGEPACVVLEVDLPGLGGLDLQQLLSEQAPALRFVFVTASRDAAAAVRALKAGAVDYLFKPVGEDELLAAVQRALGQAVAARRAAAELDAVQRRAATLTAREREVMDLVVRGQPNKRIADTLGLSLVTVKQHRGRVMRKMEAPSLADLVRMHDQLAGHSQHPEGG
jgi:FixJ family two-component response regulator